VEDLTESVQDNNKRAILADTGLLLVALMWGGGFVAVKDSLNHITPMYIMALRFLFATILMAVVFYKQLRNITKKDIISGSIVGILLFMGFLAQTIGMQYTTVGKNAFLTATNVVIVPFLAWIIYKKNPGWYSVGAALLCLLGIGFLTLQGSKFVINIGDSLTLICAVFFAGHIVSVGYFASDSDPIILSIVQLGFAAIASILCALIFEPMPTVMNKNVFIGIGYLAIFSTMFAFLIQNVAQKYTRSTHAAVILCLESVFGSILGVIILNDIFTKNMIMGCILIFVGIIISETKLSFLSFMKSKEQVKV
jgi:drug/metabolite transporter (DMT)-like permease